MSMQMTLDEEGKRYAYSSERKMNGAYLLGFQSTVPERRHTTNTMVVLSVAYVKNSRGAGSKKNTCNNNF
jgi:hypothetical protein